jgi:hypothetical protein
MPVFSIENEYNNNLQLTQQENRWQVLSVTGLNPPPAAIATSIIPTFDGERFNSSRLQARNIVITLAINGNAEENRMALNKVVLPKRYIKVKYKNNTKDIFIEGHVESFEYDVFEDMKMRAQASIICTDPYWKDLEESETIIKSIINLFEFPFSIPKEGIAISEILNTDECEIINQGSIETGCTMEIEFINNVLNPYIENITTGEKMIINRELTQGDVLMISTQRGNKSIKLYKNGIITNIINDLDESSQWITLTAGANRFIYGAAAGAENMQIKIKYRNLYGGV